MAEETVHVCIDRYLEDGMIPGQGDTRAAYVVRKLWKPGEHLRIRFLDGDSRVQQKVADVAKEWMQYANIKLDFGDDPGAEIRISFKESGSWSYIGTDARSIAKSRATMNYGWLTPTSSDDEYNRVVLHEFGHALGCLHEHQNPATNIPWDKEAVYQYYMGPPNNWSRQQVDTNLFNTYAASLTKFSDFDAASIMLYPIQNRFTIGDFEVGWNRALSETDKWFVGTVYPFGDQPTLKVDGGAVDAEISERGEVDVYTFRVEKTAPYRIETTGRTDVKMALSGPDNAANVIAQDDDSGRGLNARIITPLAPGLYTVSIRHYSARRTGGYSISVSTAT